MTVLLPPLGALACDDPCWRYPSQCMAGDGIGHLRVWAAGVPTPGHLAAVTETGLGASITNSAPEIWAELAARYPGRLVVLEHYPASESFGGGEHLDSVEVTGGGHPAWSRIWPTPPANPDHGTYQTWMARHGHLIVASPVQPQARGDDEDR